MSCLIVHNMIQALKTDLVHQHWKIGAASSLALHLQYLFKPTMPEKANDHNFEKCYLALRCVLMGAKKGGRCS